jgi:hypothetical protein
MGHVRSRMYAPHPAQHHQHQVIDDSAVDRLFVEDLERRVW